MNPLSPSRYMRKLERERLSEEKWLERERLARERRESRRRARIDAAAERIRRDCGAMEDPELMAFMSATRSDARDLALAWKAMLVPASFFFILAFSFASPRCLDDQSVLQPLIAFAVIGLAFALPAAAMALRLWRKNIMAEAAWKIISERKEEGR